MQEASYCTTPLRGASLRLRSYPNDLRIWSGQLLPKEHAVTQGARHENPKAEGHHTRRRPGRQNASFSRESRFKIKHFRIEFTDRQLVALAALRTLRGFMFLAFGGPVVDFRTAFHAFSDLLESMSWRETISFYVVQIQFI